VPERLRSWAAARGSYPSCAQQGTTAGRAFVGCRLPEQARESPPPPPHHHRGEVRASPPNDSDLSGYGKQDPREPAGLKTQRWSLSRVPKPIMSIRATSATAQMLAMMHKR
jgi:hypothetical protein